jgi:hypothetical protein
MDVNQLDFSNIKLEDNTTTANKNASLLSEHKTSPSPIDANQNSNLEAIRLRYNQSKTEPGPIDNQNYIRIFSSLLIDQLNAQDVNALLESQHQM